MNVRTLCLAVLNCGEATGYEIRKLVTDGHFSHFVDASYGSIYPALAKLEQEGLVTSCSQAQEGKPNRKVYSIEPAGHEEFICNLSKPAQKDIFKSEFLLLAMFAEKMQPADVSRAIDAQIIYLESEMATIHEHRDSVQLTCADWVADYGMCCLTSALNYIIQNRQALEATAGTALHDNAPLYAAE